MNREPLNRGPCLPPSLEARIEAIARVAEAWRAPRSPWRRRAVREISQGGAWSAPMVEACLRSVFHGWDAAALREWVAHDLAPDFPQARPGSKALILLPSTVFAAAWQSAAAAWLAGARPVLKPSRREPIFAKILVESVRAVAGRCLPIQILSRRPARFKAFAAVAAYGSDETLATLGAGRFLTEFGTRISLGCVARDSLTHRQARELARRAAVDAMLYDTRGCLSPQAFFVETDGAVSPETWAELLDAEMKKLERRWPRRKRTGEDLETENFWQQWRFRASQGRARIVGRHVILHREPLLEPADARRVVFVIPIRDFREIPHRCGPWFSRLSTLGVSSVEVQARLRRLLGRGDATRLGLLGEMHQPPPCWRNGGISLLRRFAGFQE